MTDEIKFMKLAESLMVAPDTEKEPYIAPEWTDEQQQVIELQKQGRNVLVTGEAGTGKSLLLTHLAETCGEGFSVVASTGIAAVNVGGMTIHSWSGVGIGDDDPIIIAQGIKYGRKDVADRIRRATTLAVDEVSMLNAYMIELVDIVFRTVRDQPDDPFGGIQMIFFGDFLQLPPVSKENKKATQFAFDSKTWKASNIQTVRLTKVFRQKNVHFKEALSSIRIGDKTGLAKRLFKACARRIDKDPTIKPVKLHSHNKDADAINLHELSQIEGQEKSYICVDEGDEKGKLLLQKNCIAPDILSLKEGAQVMLLTNLDVENGLANGSIGKVCSLKDEIRVDFPDYGTVPMEPHKWEIKEEGKVIASRSQIPLRLAYAITIHKSQGLQFDKLRVYLAKCFEFGQAYVALSRAKSHEGLYIDTPYMRSVKAHPKALHFYGIISDEELEALGYSNKPEEQEEKQDELFD